MPPKSLFLLLIFLLAACAAPAPAPTATPLPATATRTPAPTASFTPTSIPTITPTPAPWQIAVTEFGMPEAQAQKLAGLDVRFERVTAYVPDGVRVLDSEGTQVFYTTGRRSFW